MTATQLSKTLTNGARSRVWRSYNNDTASNADGGWNQTLNGIDPSKSYMSIVFVKRASSSTNGCSITAVAAHLRLTSVVRQTPTRTSNNIGTCLKTYGACLSVLSKLTTFNTTHSTVGGLYRLDTGAKVTSYATYKMKSGVTTRVHTYLYYSTDPAADIRWWNPALRDQCWRTHTKPVSTKSRH